MVWIPAAIGGTLALLSAYMAWKNYSEYTVIVDTPTSKIRSAPMGLVEVQGNVVSQNTIQSPLSGKPCVAYELIYERYEVQRDKNKTKRRWRRLTTEREQDTFTLSDDTGNLNVVPQGSELSIKPNNYYYARAGMFSGISQAWNQMSSKQGTIAGVPIQNFQQVNSLRTGWARANDIRVTEKLLMQNDNVYVLGTLQDEGGQKAIKKSDTNKYFFIYQGSIKDVVSSKRWMSIGFTIATIIIIFVLVYVFQRGI